MRTNKILPVELVQSNEVGGSARMELEGLVRSIRHLEGWGVSISTLVTDRHSQIKKYLREKHPDIKHLFDCWHVAKGIKKKLMAASHRKGFERIGLWTKSITKHLYHCAATSGGDGELMQTKWLSMLNHIGDVHTGHIEISGRRQKLMPEERISLGVLAAGQPQLRRLRRGATRGARAAEPGYVTDLRTAKTHPLGGAEDP
ncbi:uncharacterized protein ISCGN_010799 [Ixodes scapularis]